MTRLAHSLTVSSLLVSAIAVAALAWHAGAARSGAGPVTVAVVNLNRAQEGLEQRADAQIALVNMAEQAKSEGEQRQKAIEDMRTQLRAAREAKDVARGQSLEEEIALKTLNFQAWQQFISNKMDVEKALLLQELYRDIRAAIGEMAVTEGYDLVLVDDSEGPLGWDNESPMTREAQIQRQVAARRILYTSPTIDATDALVTRMNNAYRAGARTP